MRNKSHFIIYILIKKRKWCIVEVQGTKIQGL